MNLYYKTELGQLYLGDSLEIINNENISEYVGKVNLIVTSPPFPLNNKKKYGNEIGEEYLKWFKKLTPVFNQLLADDGSLVIEIGNAWEPGRPVQSTLHLECLFEMTKQNDSELRLIQEFICYNPAKLPSPAQWVTVNRIRTVDSYTHVWWLAKTDHPKADNKKVLRPYSKSMRKLLERQSYNSGIRPSEHNISEKGFLKDNGGSISHNFFELEPIDEFRDVRLPHNVMSYSNVSSNDFFIRKCKEMDIKPHPARMNKGIVNFFIDFLTDENDLVFDPFGGSNTTGFCAELKKRRWLAIEADEKYAKQSKIRFEDPLLKKEVV
ncbi:DNA methyltransferase [Pantoea ananatis BRT175]|uniref:DNA-methyltransferase n=1 Tax=Pantoea ananas TaxID=553 RepID=UPI0003B1A5AA|nr:site-specific DNA-methyltransferase [Pantoea ananatis]ERM15499.1 DNA methyltransferase [Pantoea ananatis BRT175]